MRPLGFISMAHIGFAAALLVVTPSLMADTVTVDLGTLVYAINVNASIYNPAFPTLPETYTYNQLLQNPDNPTFTLGNGNTIDQELTALGYGTDDGVLNYDFPFPSGYSFGSYSQDGTPVFSTTSLDIGPGIFQNFTATSVSGDVCPGDNNAGATLSLDPTNSAATYAAILGCDGITGLNPGSPTSTTSTVLINLGTYTSGDTTTTYEGEETVTTWESSGEVGQPSSVPEPSALGFETAGLLALCGFGARKRLRKVKP